MTAGGVCVLHGTSEHCFGAHAFYLKRHVCCTPYAALTPPAALYPSCFLHLSIASFSLMLDVIPCCAARCHAVRACGLGAIGYTVQSGCVVGYAIQACVSALNDVHTRVELSNDAFLRTYPRC